MLASQVGAVRDDGEVEPRVPSARSEDSDDAADRDPLEVLLLSSFTSGGAVSYERGTPAGPCDDPRGLLTATLSKYFFLLSLSVAERLWQRYGSHGQVMAGKSP